MNQAVKRHQKSEAPSDFEHEVHRGLRIYAGFSIEGVFLLEVCTPEPCIGIVQIVEQVVYMETESQSPRLVILSANLVILSASEGSPQRHLISKRKISYKISRDRTLER